MLHQVRCPAFTFRPINYCYMKIAFHGAAQCVTGSKHLLTLQSGKKILFDCGMFQGMGKQTDELNASFGFNAREIDYLLL